MNTTFENAKVGDKVWSIRNGDCIISSIDYKSTYPIDTLTENGEEHSFTLAGKYGSSDQLRSLFWSNPNIIAPEEPTRLPTLMVDTKLVVWSDKQSKEHAHFSHFNDNGRCVCFHNGSTSWTTEYLASWDYWELADE